MLLVGGSKIEVVLGHVELCTAKQAVIEADFSVALRSSQGLDLAAGGVLQLSGAGVGVCLLDALAQRNTASLLGLQLHLLGIEARALHISAHLQAI